jgi:MbtH protein
MRITKYPHVSALVPANGPETDEREDEIMFEDDDNRVYVVVMNEEERYSIWPDAHPMPTGWEALDSRGTKRECLDFIDREWTDMRPLSLRRQMTAQ